MPHHPKAERKEGGGEERSGEAHQHQPQVLALPVTEHLRIGLPVSLRRQKGGPTSSVSMPEGWSWQRKGSVSAAQRAMKKTTKIVPMVLPHKL